MIETEVDNSEMLLAEKAEIEQKLKSMNDAEKLNEFGIAEDIAEAAKLETRITEIEKQLKDIANRSV